MSKFNVGVSDSIVALKAELKPYQRYIKGKTLNAGSGQRKIELGDDCYNLDIDGNNHPDIHADLNDILPIEDNSFDTVVSVACLEHVPRPWFTIKELYRVLKPGGFIVLNIPFMQPFHAWPNDYTRFTSEGMKSLLQEGKFEVIEVNGNQQASFGYTLSWLLTEYYVQNKRLWRIHRFFWKPIMYLLKRGYLFGRKSPNTESSYFAVGKKI